LNIRLNLFDYRRDTETLSWESFATESALRNEGSCFYYKFLLGGLLVACNKVSPILKLFEVSDPRRKSIEQKPIGLWFGVELIAPKGSTPANRIG
jgi:hypothetical protein